MGFGDLFSADSLPLSEGIRRLPIYLLLDTSGSMKGTGIDSLNEGLKVFKKEVLNDKYAKDTIHVCIIEFNTNAKMITDGLISIEKLNTPNLVATGLTNLSEAFELLNQSLDKDIIQNVVDQKRGDWHPIIYVLTDGKPEPEKQNWKESREKILKRSKSNSIKIITVGCGSNITEEIIKDISTGRCFKMSDSEVSFKHFFEWVTQTALDGSREYSKQANSAQDNFNPPPPPESITEI